MILFDKRKINKLEQSRKLVSLLRLNLICELNSCYVFLFSGGSENCSKEILGRLSASRWETSSLSWGKLLQKKLVIIQNRSWDFWFNRCNCINPNHVELVAQYLEKNLWPILQIIRYPYCESPWYYVTSSFIFRIGPFATILKQKNRSITRFCH